MSNYWLMSDPHLGHKRIIGFGSRKPGFEQKMLKSIKSVVRSDDVLICLGDVAFGEVDLWHRRLCGLPGTKWLIRGNHDDKSMQWYMDRGWDFVAETAVVKFLGKKILFSHVPAIKPVGDSFPSHSPDINIHGHMHGMLFGNAHPSDPEHVPGWHYEIHMEHTMAPVNLKFVLECVGNGRDYGCGPVRAA